MEETLKQTFTEIGTKMTELLKVQKHTDQVVKETMVANLKAEFRGHIKDPRHNFMMLLRLAFRLKELSGQHLHDVKKMKKQLPESIRTMVWSNFCLRHFNDSGLFLFASDNNIFDKPASTDQRVGLAPIEQNNSVKFSWTAQLSDDGDSVYIKSVLLDQYLFATKGKFTDGDYRKIHLAPKSENNTFKWKLHPYSNSGDEVSVKNVGYSEYLEHKCGHSKPPVFTTCTDTTEYYWAVEKC
jgi:hypothetical protein